MLPVRMWMMILLKLLNKWMISVCNSLLLVHQCPNQLCIGLHPSIYLGYNVLSGQFELYDPETSNVYIPFARPDTDYLLSVFEDYNVHYRFGGQDAIIWRGCTPPTVKYFGYRSFSAARITDQDDNTVPTEFTVLRASLGESINQLVVNTESNDDTLFPEPFDRKTNIVTTGDVQTWTDVMNAYVNAGLLDQMSLNLNAIPFPLFEYSESELDTPRDTIGLLLEIVFDPDSPCNNDLYLNQSFPFRLFYKDESDPREAIDSNNRDDSNQNITKCDRNPSGGNEDSFDNAVDDIINYFQNKFGYTFIIDTQFDDINGISVGNNDAVDLNIFGYGEHCISNQVNCMCDNRDNFYRWTGEDYTLSDTNFYVIVGFNHNNFGSSVFNSLTVSRVFNQDSGNIMDGVGLFINYGFEKYGYDLISNGVICDNDNPSPCDEAFLENIFVVAVARPEHCNVTADGIFPMCFNNDMLADDDCA